MPFAPRPTLRLIAVALAAAAPAMLGACDALNQAQSSYVAIGLLTSTASHSVGGTTVPAATAFVLTFGKMDQSAVLSGQTSASSFTAVKDAVVTLNFTDPTQTGAAADVQLNADPKNDGRYVLDSANAQKLAYFPKQVYTATISYSGETFKMKVTAAEPVKIKEFEAPATQPLSWKPGTAFPVTRDPAKGVAANDIAFVALQSTSGGATPAWTNMPQDVTGFVNLALSDSEWRADAFSIPGAKLAPSSGYFVALTAMQKGEQITDANVSPLFTASTFLAGIADGGAVATSAQ